MRHVRLRGCGGRRELALGPRRPLFLQSFLLAVFIRDDRCQMPAHNKLITTALKAGRLRLLSLADRADGWPWDQTIALSSTAAFQSSSTRQLSVRPYLWVCVCVQARAARTCCCVIRLIVCLKCGLDRLGSAVASDALLTAPTTINGNIIVQ